VLSKVDRVITRNAYIGQTCPCYQFYRQPCASPHKRSSKWSAVAFSRSCLAVAICGTTFWYKHVSQLARAVPSAKLLLLDCGFSIANNK
ncbi:hypothetical protein NDU88_008009, partial [Pleurodeles waltl]